MPTQKKTLYVYLTEQEMAFVATSAARARLSMSTYAKRICLGYEIKSQIENSAILELIKLRADMGRLGGLLKMALGDKSLERTKQITKFINELEDNKQAVMTVIKQINESK